MAELENQAIALAVCLTTCNFPLHLSKNQNNKIQEISSKISYMKKLGILDLSDNELTELPQTIGRLKYLERLIIRGNEFSDEEIKKIEKMLPNTVIEYK
ncbi:MAG: Leucine-rich repeat (LRR) protein [Maribacter sp.]|jgi:Leucine-rich repeat (LRR) protein